MEEQAKMVAGAFVEHYYNLFDHNRSSLIALYQPTSMLTFEGQRIQGTDDILAKLTQLPFDQCRHVISTVDSQPSALPGGIVVFVSGSLQLHGEEHPLRFSQMFHLIPTGQGSYFVQNDIFRLNYGLALKVGKKRSNLFDNTPVSTVFQMGTKMKGIYKGFKYGLTQMFVVKEQEMEIGGPTDVKHVAHIGMDGSSGSAPSWMNEYKTTGNDFAATSIGNSASGSASGSPWSSREFGDSMRQQPDETSTEGAVVKKKEKRKKPRSSTSPKSNNGTCSSRPSRAGKPKPKFIEDNAKPTNIEVV